MIKGFRVLRDNMQWEAVSCLRRLLSVIAVKDIVWTEYLLGYLRPTSTLWFSGVYGGKCDDLTSPEAVITRHHNTRRLRTRTCNQIVRPCLFALAVTRLSVIVRQRVTFESKTTSTGPFLFNQAGSIYINRLSMQSLRHSSRPSYEGVVSIQSHADSMRRAPPPPAPNPIFAVGRLAVLGQLRTSSPSL